MQDEATDAAFHCSNPRQRFIQVSLSCAGYNMPLEGTLTEVGGEAQYI